MFGSFHASHSLTAGRVCRRRPRTCRCTAAPRRARSCAGRSDSSARRWRPSRRSPSRACRRRRTGRGCRTAARTRRCGRRAPSCSRGRRGSPRCAGAPRHAVPPTPVEVQPDLLHVQLLEQRERRVDRPVERLRLVVDADAQVAGGVGRLRRRSDQRRRHTNHDDRQTPPRVKPRPAPARAPSTSGGGLPRGRSRAPSRESAAPA